jgi:hypothetical protein
VFNVAKTTRVAIRNRERFSSTGLPLASTSVEKRLQSRFLSRLGKMGHGGVIFLFLSKNLFTLSCLRDLCWRSIHTCSHRTFFLLFSSSPFVFVFFKIFFYFKKIKIV